MYSNNIWRAIYPTVRKAYLAKQRQKVNEKIYHPSVAPVVTSTGKYYKCK